MFFADELYYKSKDKLGGKATMNSIHKECSELKRKYDACYTVWFTDRFLNGDSNDDACAPLFASYQQCLKVDYLVPVSFNDYAYCNYAQC